MSESVQPTYTAQALLMIGVGVSLIQTTDYAGPDLNVAVSGITLAVIGLVIVSIRVANSFGLGDGDER